MILLLLDTTNRTIIALMVMLILSLVAGAGCQTTTSAVSGNQNAPTAIATPTSRVTRTPTLQITPTPTVQADTPITLTFWTVEPVSSLAPGDLGEFFRNGIRAFERTNPDVKVEVFIKKASGKGGVIDFLRTSKEVAPSVLPDVAIMNATDLTQALNGGLVQRLDGKLDRSIVQDLLPAARRMGTVNDVLIGVPLGIDMQHTVYNTLTFTSTMVTWTDVLSQDRKFVFPAKGVNGLVNDATLSQYFSAGGDLLDDQGAPKIDDRVLQDVLRFYQQALENNIIDPSILEASTTEELWPIYLEGQASVAQISVRQYLTDRDLLTSTAYGPLPMQNITDTPLGVTHGWVLVLVTDDIARQKSALRLMEFFLSTTRNATWNQMNNSIPVRDSAYRQLAGDDPYWQFLTEQLNAARPEPRFLEYDRIGRILQQAVEQVIRGEATPEEATITAIDALTQ